MFKEGGDSPIFIHVLQMATEGVPDSLIIVLFIKKMDNNAYNRLKGDFTRARTFEDLVNIFMDKFVDNEEVCLNK